MLSLVESKDGGKDPERMLTGEALTEGATTRSIPENTKTTTSRFLRQHLKELIHQETHKGGVCKFPKGGAGTAGADSILPRFSFRETHSKHKSRPSCTLAGSNLLHPNPWFVVVTRWCSGHERSQSGKTRRKEKRKKLRGFAL